MYAFDKDLIGLKISFLEEQKNRKFEIAIWRFGAIQITPMFNKIHRIIVFCKAHQNAYHML